MNKNDDCPGNVIDFEDQEIQVELCFAVILMCKHKLALQLQLLSSYPEHLFVCKLYLEWEVQNRP